MSKPMKLVFLVCSALVTVSLVLVVAWLTNVHPTSVAAWWAMMWISGESARRAMK